MVVGRVGAEQRGQEPVGKGGVGHPDQQEHLLGVRVERRQEVGRRVRAGDEGDPGGRQLGLELLGHGVVRPALRVVVADLGLGGAGHLLDQLLRRRKVVDARLRARQLGVPRQAPRDEAVGGHEDVAVDQLGDRLAVDRKAHRPAQAGVLQGRVRQVESQRDLGGERREATAPEVAERLRHGVRCQVADVDPPRLQVTESCGR